MAITDQSIEIIDGKVYLHTVTVRCLGPIEDCADDIPLPLEEDYEEELAAYRDAVRAREAYESEGKRLWEER